MRFFETYPTWLIFKPLALAFQWPHTPLLYHFIGSQLHNLRGLGSLILGPLTVTTTSTKLTNFVQHTETVLCLRPELVPLSSGPGDSLLTGGEKPLDQLGTYT